jgi:WD40 repeat protein/tRNA A-37 threonylcarbamoyl transferase component Bud32
MMGETEFPDDPILADGASSTATDTGRAARRPSLTPRATTAAGSRDADAPQDAAPKAPPADQDTVGHSSDLQGSMTDPGDAPPLVARRSSPAIPGYEIEGELGRGGMGVVYKARNLRLNRGVALKMILAGQHAGHEAAVRFLVEAEAVAKVQHPNIVQIFHIAEHDGHPYFEMEYVGGGSLADRLDGVPRPPREAAGLVQTLARAMAEAHRQGIVHRDLKPGNILLTPAGTPKIADFGLAKLLNVESGLTRTDSVLGSPSYMAPEQAEGRAKETGPAADVYALGVILYELLTGRPPFRGATALDTLQQVKTAEPLPPSRLVPGLPRDLETIALKCLQKDPGKRYESALALAEDLGRFQAGEPIVARPVSAAERAWRWCRRNRLLAGSLGATAAALVAVTVISTVFSVKQAEAVMESSRRLAALDYERGLAACEKGEIGVGLLRLVESWRSAVAAGNRGTGWRHTARTSISAWQRRLPELRAVFSHASRVTSLAFRPDGKTLITGSEDNTARLWDAATGQTLGHPLAHQGMVQAVAFSPDGKVVMTGSADNTARLWDAATGRPRGQPLAHQGAVSAVAFSPDGKIILTGSEDCRARLWDAATGEPLGQPLRHQAPVVSVAFSPDSRAVITGSFDRTARLWDAATGRPIGQPLRHQGRVWSVAFGPDGKAAVTGGEDNTARLWDAATGRPIGHPLVHRGWVQAVAISPDGKTVLSGSYDRTARLWDAATGQPIGEFLMHQAVIRAVAFSPDGKTVITGGNDDTARLWDASAGRLPSRPILTHEEKVLGAAFSPDGKLVATSGYDKTARLWDAATGRPIGKPLMHSAGVWSVAFSPDGKTLLTGSEDGTVRLWDASTGQPVGQPLTHRGAVYQVTFSPDGKTLLTGSLDRTARLWDAATGQPRGQPLMHQDAVNGVAFSPDGQTVITGSKDGRAQLWDASTGQPLNLTLTHQDAVYVVAFSPDGQTLLTGSQDWTARLWDAATGRPRGQPLAHQGAVFAVAFSPDGKIILTGSEDCRARLWDAATGQPLGQTLAHQGTIWQVAFSPDGQTVITSSDDKTARLWDVATELPDALERVATWVESLTGLTVDASGSVQVLDNPAWLQRRKRVEQQGGPPVADAAR